jgi:hypothetical protein
MLSSRRLQDRLRLLGLITRAGTHRRQGARQRPLVESRGSHRRPGQEPPRAGTLEPDEARRRGDA